MSTLKCILVIEDDAVIGMTLADCLGDAGFKVPKPICSLEHALVAVEEFAPDAAVLDLSLRDGSGFSLAAELKHRGVPFLVYSGYPREARPCLRFRMYPGSTSLERWIVYWTRFLSSWPEIRPAISQRSREV
jgi:DNA-binding NtrC family response regulator